MGDQVLRDSPYNSELEYSLRAVIILAELEYPMTLERLVSYDFISVYPSAFGLSGKSIHGENTLKFSEFSSRRVMMKKAVDALVFRNLIQMIVSSKGYEYNITDKGIAFAEKMQNAYSHDLRLNVISTDEAFFEKDDVSIAKMINEKAIETLEN